MDDLLENYNKCWDSSTISSFRFWNIFENGTSAPDSNRSRQLVDSNVAVYLPISTTAYVLSSPEVIVNSAASDIVYFNGGVPRTTGTVSVNIAQSYFYAIRIA